MPPITEASSESAEVEQSRLTATNFLSNGCYSALIQRLLLSNKVLFVWAGILRSLVVWLRADLLDHVQGHDLRSSGGSPWH